MMFTLCWGPQSGSATRFQRWRFDRTALPRAGQQALASTPRANRRVFGSLNAHDFLNAHQ